MRSIFSLARGEENALVKLVGIPGSLRRASYNAALLRAAVGLAPDGVEVASALIRGVPLYDGDLEAAEGVPPVVSALKDLVAAADGLLLVTPEYNNGIPGVFKNAIDWMSRPASDIPRVFGGKPVALLGASPGSFGTILSQAGWLPVLRALGAEPWFGGRLLVSRAGTAFGPEGELASDEVREQLRRFVAGFAAFAARSR